MLVKPSLSLPLFITAHSFITATDESIRGNNLKIIEEGRKQPIIKPSDVLQSPHMGPADLKEG